MAGLFETLLKEAGGLGKWKWIAITILVLGIVVFAVFSQLADPTKEAIVLWLIDGEKATEAASFPGIEILSKEKFSRELKVGREKVANQYNYRNDGKASQRIFHVITSKKGKK